MRKLHLTALLLTCVLATSGFTCAGKPQLQPASCPQPPQPPAPLMVAPTTGSTVRAELLAPPTDATPR